MSLELIKFLDENYKNTLNKFYEIEQFENPVDTLTAVAEKRGCIQKGNELDLDKAAGIIMDDFKSGRLGKITLEFPELEEQE